MFTPVLNIGPHWVEPSHEGFQIDVTGEQMLRAARVAPGVLDGLALHPLSKETQFVDDPLVGQIPFRAREISPLYKAFWLGAGLKGPRKWILLPSDSEVAQREVSRRGIEAQLALLLEKTGRDIVEFQSLQLQCESLRRNHNEAGATALWNQVLAKLSPEERGRAAGYGLLLAELGREGNSFLEEVPNLFNSGVTGVRWNLAVPNIDVAIASSWTCEADQKQSFRIQRLSTLEEQVRSQFEIRIGNGKTLYALVLTEDESVEFRHYRNTSPTYSLADRADDEEEWKRVLATGYLTASDKAQIVEWSAQITALKKSAGATGNKPTGPAAAQIESLKADIARLRQSKSGLTDANGTRVQALEKRLFIDRVPVALQEDARSLFDREVDITLGFHRKGYVSVRIGLGAKPGSEAFYYPIEGIVKTGRPGTILPAGSRILLRSNGGVWGAIHGLTDAPEKARLYSQPVYVAFPFDPSEWSIHLDAIGQNPDEADPSQPLTVLPRARIESRVEEVEGQTQFSNHTGPTQVRFCLDFFCDQNPATGARDYASELYRATATCKAGDLPPLTFDTWTARAAGFPIENVGLQADAERGPLHELQIIDTQNRPANLPLDLAERAVEFGLIDTRPGPSMGQYIPLMRGGTVAEPSARDVRRFRGADGKLRLFLRPETRRTLLLRSVESLFDVPVRVPLIGNDQWPGDYLRDLFNVHGAPEELLTGLPLGPESHTALRLSKLPSARVGTYPSIKPNRGDSCWSFAQQLVLKHLFGFRLRRDPVRGIAIERNVFRATDFAYSTSLPERDMSSVQRPLSIWQDVSDYVTDATFFGAFNQGTGRRTSGRIMIHEATKKGSAFYIGRHRPYFAAPDESLGSDVKCILAVRQFLMWHALPPWFASWVSWYDPRLREGDIVTMDGIRFVVQSLDVASFTRAREQKFTITARLMDDVPVWAVLS